VTISKGSAYGSPGVPLPVGGVVARTDHEARLLLEQARTEGRPWPVVGLLGGDLCRTLGGGRGDEAHLRSTGAVTFTVDVGQVLVDGRLHLFVAHCVARSPSWRRTVAAMNAQWFRDWNLGPRAHPNDGLVDVYDATLTFADLPKVRARLRSGTHVPHPRISVRRSTAVQVELDRPLSVWLDGEVADRGRVLSLRVEPDALTVVV
jgi:hypothetical protein